jgi:hypothetical protein
MIYEHVIRSAQTVHLSCTDTNTVSKWIEMRIHMTHSPRSSFRWIQNDFLACDTFGTIHAPILRHDYHYIQTDRNEISNDPRHLGVPSGGSKMICKPMVHLVQNMHLSCVKVTICKRTDSNTVSKRTKIRFHMTHVT